MTNPRPTRGCATCYYYVPLEGVGAHGGTCRRFPPFSNLNQTHPRVCPDQWCGEWKKRPKVKT